MTRIYLIRHAEAEGNYYRRIQGWYNGRITARGQLQIAALAERFRDIKIDALYSSDLRRTMVTAGAIQKYHDLPLHTDASLREVNMGSWEDVLWGNAAYDDPEQMLMFSTDPERWSIPGGENFRRLQARITGAVSEIASKHDGQTVAIVSHGAAIRSLISGVKNIPSERISEIPHGDNTCVALLEYEAGKLEVGYYNDNSHLVEEISTFAGQKWWKTAQNKPDMANLRLIPMNISEDAQLYKDCYSDSWQNAHGSLLGFDGDIYLGGAEKASSKNPRCLMKAYTGTDFAGIIELDPQRMSSCRAGWISFFYLLPEYRGNRFGPQLLGHAVSFFRALGRDKLRLHVAETNKGAIHFYEREGFSQVGADSAASGALFLMEMGI